MLYLFLFIFIVDTLLFSYILYLQLVEGKATSRYLWLTPQFYSDLLQTLLSRVYNSLEWGLNSPPKPHAFVSLPVQSGLFSFTFSINSILSKCKSNFYVFLWAFVLVLAYKLPTKILLDQLGLLAYYPIFNVMFALLSVVVIANLKGNKVTKAMIIIGAVLGFSIPYLVLYVYDYFYEPLTNFLLEGFSSLTLLLSLEKLVDKQCMEGCAEIQASNIRKDLTSKRQVMHSTRNTSGDTGINVGGSGSGDSGGASSSHDTSTKIKKVSQTARSSGNNSITAKARRESAFKLLSQLDTTDPRVLSESLKWNSPFKLLPKSAISDDIQN